MTIFHKSQLNDGLKRTILLFEKLYSNAITLLYDLWLVQYVRSYITYYIA